MCIWLMADESAMHTGSSFADPSDRENAAKQEVAACLNLESNSRQVHRQLRHLVIRQVCNRQGDILGYLAQPHDGSEPSMVEAAETLSRRMYAMFEDVSNMASATIITDEHGKARWRISPNCKVITQL